MDDPIEIVINRLNEMTESFAQMQQMNTLRTLKNEYEIAILKNMLFKNIADQKGSDIDEVASKYESLLHVALLSGFDAMREALSNVDEGEIRRHLGLDD